MADPDCGDISHTPPRVFLVGAGPGNAGLITLRAVECLRQADLVIYDQLTSPSLLEHAPARARLVCVNELHPSHPERAPLVSQMLLDAAGRGQCVVRLKGGDPFLFGRGGEEAEVLRQAGIPYEVVPGVTAGLGAAAFAGIPLTHRLHASAVALVTGHERADRGEGVLDWEALARFPGTLVIYMGLGRLGANVRALLDHGKGPATPAAAIQWATTGRQRTVEAPLARLPEAVRDAGLSSPTLVIVGEVVSLRPRLSWFEHLPLVGQRVLVARPRHQAGDVVRRLELLGAVVASVPAVEVREPDSWQPLDDVLARLGSFHWLVFTSVNGVHYFLRRLCAGGRDLRALGGLRLAVIGPATGEALRGYHLEPDLMPAEFRSESLAAALRERARGQRILLARADRGRDVLRQVLGEVADVEQVPVYSQVDAVGADTAELGRAWEEGIDYVLVTSSNIGRALLRALPEARRQALREGTPALISISPVTSEALRQEGMPVAAEASEYTVEGVIQALVSLVWRKRARAGGAGG